MKDRKIKKEEPNISSDDIITSLDLKNPQPLTQDELKELEMLDSFTDEQVIAAAMKDPDCQLLV